MTTIASITQTCRLKTAEFVSCAEVSARVIAALAASLALLGCTTPILKSSVEVPSRYASAEATTLEPEIAWWEELVLSGVAATKSVASP